MGQLRWRQARRQEWVHHAAEESRATDLDLRKERRKVPFQLLLEQSLSTRWTHSPDFSGTCLACKESIPFKQSQDARDVGGWCDYEFVVQGGHVARRESMRCRPELSQVTQHEHLVRTR